MNDTSLAICSAFSFGLISTGFAYLSAIFPQEYTTQLVVCSAITAGYSITSAKKAFDDITRDRTI